MKRVLLASLLGVLGSVGCAYQNPTQPGAVAVDLSVPTQLTLGVLSGTAAQGGTATLTAHVQNANGAGLANVLVTFSTSGGTISPTRVATDVAGTATATLAATDAANVTAAAGTLSAHALVAAPPPAPTTPVPTPTPIPAPSPGPSPTPAGVFLNVASSVQTGVPLAFSVSSSATGVTWNWSFGDGGSAQTTAFNTTYTYASAGTYTASVFGAGTAVASATITVTNPPAPAPVPPAPTPAYTVTLAANPTSVLIGGSSTLTATVNAQNGAPAPTSFAWDCKGDGVTIVTNASPTQSCTYPTVGSFNSKVTVTGGTVTGNGSTTVTVSPLPTPVITVSCGTVTFAAQPIRCTVSATLAGSQVPSSSITITAWDWGDNTSGTLGAGAVSQTKTYPAANSYHVVVSATVPGGGAAGTGTGTAIVQ